MFLFRLDSSLPEHSTYLPNVAVALTYSKCSEQNMLISSSIRCPKIVWHGGIGIVAMRIPCPRFEGAWSLVFRMWKTQLLSWDTDNYPLAFRVPTPPPQNQTDVSRCTIHIRYISMYIYLILHQQQHKTTLISSFCMIPFASCLLLFFLHSLSKPLSASERGKS